ncbi:MAG: ATP-binding protein [Acidobacteria bacterium]|nr:ATP-binding protein [Acidobacteriota bacterium]
MTGLAYGSAPCRCRLPEHAPRLVVVTGGPGAGKTAILELARRSFCEHVAILPEAASIVFGGGFPRHAGLAARRAAQRAIYHVQREVENVVLEERRVAVALCDRGTVDGLGYWPDEADELWHQVGTDVERELARYGLVLHLETPTADDGYVNDPLRIETAEEARRLDRRIALAWSRHPRRVALPSQHDFTRKALAALGEIRAALPPCCSAHDLRVGEERER